MRQWNYVRKLWHWWLRSVVTLIALLIGGVCIVVAISEMIGGDWLGAASAVVPGVSLCGASIGLFYSGGNEPAVTLCTSDTEIKSFMREFISRGSAVHIASYRLSWVRGDECMEAFLRKEAEGGKDVTIFAGVADDLTGRLAEAGIRVVTYPRGLTDPPRFTFLNLGRRGAEKIAVAREGLPNHWIDVYEDKHHPQVIALARAYIQQVERPA